MLTYITVLLVCQLTGEVITRTLGLPVPGPVLGMVLLFVGLLIRRGIPDELDKVSTTLLSHLSLLFVPAGVGVMVHARLMAEEWLPLSAAIVAGTALTMAVTGWVMVKLDRKPAAPPKSADGETP